MYTARGAPRVARAAGAAKPPAQATADPGAVGHTRPRRHAPESAAGPAAAATDSPG